MSDSMLKISCVHKWQVRRINGWISNLVLIWFVFILSYFFPLFHDHLFSTALTFYGPPHCNCVFYVCTWEGTWNWTTSVSNWLRFRWGKDFRKKRILQCDNQGPGAPHHSTRDIKLQLFALGTRGFYSTGCKLTGCIHTNTSFCSKVTNLMSPDV